MSDLTSRSESYMNDLIRRGDVLALFPMNDCSDKMIGLYERVLDIPTAYDVEKVVAELEVREKASKECYVETMTDGIFSSASRFYGEKYAYNVAIEIVKMGGVK